MYRVVGETQPAWPGENPGIGHCVPALLRCEVNGQWLEYCMACIYIPGMCVRVSNHGSAASCRPAMLRLVWRWGARTSCFSLRRRSFSR